MKTGKVAYLCDRRACGKHCSYPECRHTFDISHAVNFVRFEELYMENEKEGKTDGDGFKRVSEVSSSDGESEAK